MPDGAKIVELMNEIEQLPGYHFYYEDFKGLDLSLYIFHTNFKELFELITATTTNPQAAYLYTVENKEKLDLVGYDIVRRIHNFVASVKSLVDHTRNTHNKLYKGNNLFPDYQARINADFVHNPQSQFVQKLREYAQHYKAPIISFRTNVDKEGRPVRRVLISLDELKQFDSWKSVAREHLEALTDDFNILEEMTLYRDKVNAFYEWFGVKQMEIHASELKEFDGKRAELNQLMQQ
jgi:hypothetical protein